MKGTFTRELRIDATRADNEARTVEASVSSEYPVERHFGREVLEHTKDAINLERMPLPVIESHDAYRLNVGVFEKARIDDGKLRGVLRFGKSQRASEIWHDIREGIVTAISIGYEILRGVEEDDDTVRITSWRPLEVSLVSVPADPTVGIGRSYEGISMNDTAKLSRSERRKQRDEWSEDEGYTGNDRSILEALRRQSITSAAEHFDKQCPGVLALADQAIAAGVSASEFGKRILDHMQAQQNGAKPGGDYSLGLSKREVSQFSFRRLIEAQADPKFAMREAGLELECSRELAKQIGREPRGLFVPGEIWARDLTTGIGTGTAKAGYLKGTDHLGEEFIDALRPRSAVMTAGARTLTGLQGDIDIPVLATKTTAYWVGEGSAATEGAPVFTQKTASPKTVSGYVDMTRRLRLQSDPTVESIIRNDLIQQIAAAIDQAAIQGGTTNAPTGVLGTSGIGSVTLGTNGGAPTWAMAVGLVSAVDTSDALMEGASAGFITTAGVVATLRQTPRQASGVEGNFILGEENRLLGYPVYPTSNCPSTLTKGSGSNLHAMLFGDWRQLIMCFWSAVDVLVDPYALGTSGGLRVIAFQDVDFVVRYAEAFAEANEIIVS